MGNIISGPCAGDIVSWLEVFDDTSKQCKSNCGINNFRANSSNPNGVNQIFIFGGACGFNNCTGFEADTLTPGAPYK